MWKLIATKLNLPVILNTYEASIGVFDPERGLPVEIVVL